MGWFICSGQSSKDAKKEQKSRHEDQIRSDKSIKKFPHVINNEAFKDGGLDHTAAQIFTFRELAAATKNFREDCLLGGAFGRVYKGWLESQKQITVDRAQQICAPLGILISYNIIIGKARQRSPPVETLDSCKGPLSIMLTSLSRMLRLLRNQRLCK